MGLSENLFRILREKEMSQKEFSKLSGIPESTISDWKRKGKTPGIDKLLIISKTLNVSISDLLADGESHKERSGNTSYEYELSEPEKLIIEKYRSVTDDQKERILAYLESLLDAAKQIEDKKEVFEVDAVFLQQKLLAKKLRKLAKLDRIRLDESEHASGLNLHLLQYLDYLEIDRLAYIKQYLSSIQPFMISEIKSQEKFDNAICVLDDYYRISVYIKVDATKGEEIIVSFHENNKNGIAKRNSINPNTSYVYVFADSIGSHIVGSDNYTVNLFLTRGVSSIPVNVPAMRYDDEGFLVRLTYINNAIIDVANRYLEDLYTADLDFNQVELFSSLQQLSFTSYGNDVFSNISLLIDSLFIQKNPFGKQIADSALCIYCSTIELLEKDREELLSTLKNRYKVNSIRVLPQVLERIELNLGTLEDE